MGDELHGVAALASNVSFHRWSDQLGVGRALSAHEVAKRPLDVVGLNCVAVLRLDGAEAQIEKAVGAGAAYDASLSGRRCVVASGEGHCERKGRAVGHAVEEERCVVREDSAREAMLGDVERVLPYVGERIEASVDLDELAGAHGFRQLAPGDVGIRRLSRGDIAVAVRGYVHQGVRGGSSLVCTNTLKIISYSA